MGQSHRRLPSVLERLRPYRAVSVFKIPSEPAQTGRLPGCLAHGASAASCLSIAKAMRVLAVSQATCAAARTRVAGGYVGGPFLWLLSFGQANESDSRCSAKPGLKAFWQVVQLHSRFAQPKRLASKRQSQTKTHLRPKTHCSPNTPKRMFNPSQRAEKAHPTKPNGCPQ